MQLGAKVVHYNFSLGREGEVWLYKQYLPTQHATMFTFIVICLSMMNFCTFIHDAVGGAEAHSY